MAKRMPDIIFLWFGGGNNALIPAEIKKAVAEKPENVIFAGFQPSACHTGAYDDEPFEQQAEHFLLQVVGHGAFFGQRVGDMGQAFRLRSVQ